MKQFDKFRDKLINHQTMTHKRLLYDEEELLRHQLQCTKYAEDGIIVGII
jgi:hypothetical protein